VDHVKLPRNEQEFQVTVVTELTRMRTQLDTLLGNGQPGRIGWLERKARLHDRFIWMLTGAILFGGAVIGWVLNAFAAAVPHAK
jgi:hypothetical protein